MAKIKEVFIKVFIESEADLPKKSGYYFVHKKRCYEVNPTHAYDISYFGNLSDKTYIDYWKSIDWYLQPIEIPTEESYMKVAKDIYRNSSNPEDKITAFCDGIDWLLTELK